MVDHGESGNRPHHRHGDRHEVPVNGHSCHHELPVAEVHFWLGFALAVPDLVASTSEQDSQTEASGEQTGAYK